MSREEKIKIAIEKGFTYDALTGDIYSRFGKKITTKNKRCYINFEIVKDDKKYRVYGHQFAIYYIHNKIVDVIDHINGIKDDNRIENLRIVTQQQNQFNRKNTKGYTFVSSRNKYLSQIGINGVNKNLGYYNTPEEARQAYLDAKKIYHKI